MDGKIDILFGKKKESEGMSSLPSSKNKEEMQVEEQ